MENDKKSYKYLSNVTEFRSLEVDKYDHILGKQEEIKIS